MKTNVATIKTIVSSFETHLQAEQAVTKLHENGFEIKSFSIIAMNLCAIENVKGYFTLLDLAKKWGKIGAFYGGFWGLLFGANIFTIPFIGHLLVSGPLTVILITLACALVSGILSALGAVVFNMQLLQKHKLNYETEIKAGKYMLLMEGDELLIDKARGILEVHIPKEHTAVTEWNLAGNRVQELLTKESDTIHL